MVSSDGLMNSPSLDALFADLDFYLFSTETPEMYSQLIEPWIHSQLPSRINWSVDA